MLTRLGKLERGCLAIAAATASLNLAGLAIPELGRMMALAGRPMRAESATAALLSVLCLALSPDGRSRRMHRLSVALAALIALLGAADLIASLRYALTGTPGLLHSVAIEQISGRMPAQIAACFGLLGLTLAFTRARRRFAVRIADLLTFSLSMAILVMVSGYVFGTLPIFGIPVSVPVSPQSLFCLLLLTVTAILRRTERGMFSIFLGHGIAGRLARMLSPVVLTLPFLREAARAHILGASRMPAHYATALLASMAAILSFALLLFLAWRINGMENEIRGLTLRDELTGLYNLRGFHLLAEQALRLAQRSSVPFSVLFVDLDDLKQINDSLGHRAGSGFLVETAETLQATFRETDVLGRIGGDEFAVAGQFNEPSIALAAQRLAEACARRNEEAGQHFSLSLSVGHVTTAVGRHESLDELLAEADEAMYEEKRRKKIWQSHVDAKLQHASKGPRPA